MNGKFRIDIAVAEQGDVYFFYKTKKNIIVPQTLQDIARFYMVLDPDGENADLRFFIIGQKRLFQSGRKIWGYIEKIGGRGYKVKNTAEKPQSISRQSARPAAEGVYALVKHSGHMHFIYSLELPHRLGEVQKSFGIERQGNYIFVAKNIAKDLHRYVPVYPEILNIEGTEFLLITVQGNIQELGVTVDKIKETEDSADIFNELHVNKFRHPTDPLIHGDWK